jgi:predicted metal-binding membrane protein
MASSPHSPGAALDTRPAAAPSRRGRLFLYGSIVLVTTLAWAYLIHLSRQMSAASAGAAMAQMGMVMDRPWDARDLLLTWVMWSVMMIGMMAPSATPVLLLFAGVHRGRGAPGVTPAVVLFAAGYLAVWLGFSLAAAMAQWGLHEAALLSPGMATTSRPIAGAVLIAAGAYQLTSVKTRCLANCQSPLGFLMSNWRDGPVGALSMGVRHGVFCLGCCWAIMGVLFVVGVMNLAWVAVLTIFVLVEKISPTGARLARVGGVVLIVLGVVVASR